MYDFTVLDLFSGVAGFTYGFESADWRTLAFAETDAAASAILSGRYPQIPNLGDVSKLCRRAYDCENREGEPWCPRCDAEFGECACVGADQFTDTYGFPTVITAGFPCQDISLNGKGGGAWRSAQRTLRRSRPHCRRTQSPFSPA